MIYWRATHIRNNDGLLLGPENFRHNPRHEKKMKKRALTSCVPIQCIPATCSCLCSHTTLLFSPSPSSPSPSFSCVYNRFTLPRGQHCQPSPPIQHAVCDPHVNLSDNMHASPFAAYAFVHCCQTFPCPTDSG